MRRVWTAALWRPLPRTLGLGGAPAQSARGPAPQGCQCPPWWGVREVGMPPSPARGGGRKIAPIKKEKEKYNRHPACPANPLSTCYVLDGGHNMLVIGYWVKGSFNPSGWDPARGEGGRGPGAPSCSRPKWERSRTVIEGTPTAQGPMGGMNPVMPQGSPRKINVQNRGNLKVATG